MKHTTIHCKTHDCNPAPTDHTWHFRQYIGRPLTKYERTLINRLERHRRRRSVKVHVIDQPGHDSSQLLIDYMRYLQEINPLAPCVISANTKKDAIAISQDFPGEVIPTSNKRPNAIRGRNYDMALSLNPHPRYIPAIISTILPVIFDRSGCLFIILTVPHPSLKGRAGERLPTITPFWYQQLIDPPNPPPRDLDQAIIIPINDQADKKSFPSGEDLGEAPSWEDLGEAPSGEDLGEAFEAFEATSK